MKNFTSHDAVKIIKYQSFLKYLKFFEITFKVYPKPDFDIYGLYYVIIKNQEQFVDSAFEVNLRKKSFQDVDFEKTIDEIGEKSLQEFIIKVKRNKGEEYGTE